MKWKKTLMILLLETFLSDIQTLKGEFQVTISAKVITKFKRFTAKQYIFLVLSS
jgi:hypothetical protein